jgi:hypothetical protein
VIYVDIYRHAPENASMWLSALKIIGERSTTNSIHLNSNMSPERSSGKVKQKNNLTPFVGAHKTSFAHKITKFRRMRMLKGQFWKFTYAEAWVKGFLFQNRKKAKRTGSFPAVQPLTPLFCSFCLAKGGTQMRWMMQKQRKRIIATAVRILCKWNIKQKKSGSAYIRREREEAVPVSPFSLTPSLSVKKSGKHKNYKAAMQLLQRALSA